MQVQPYRDIQQFTADAMPFLMQWEAEHNLLLGILTRLGKKEIGDDVTLAIVEEDAAPLLVAIHTPPYNLVLSVAPNIAAITCLADFLSAHCPDLSGISGCIAETEHFAACWQKSTQKSAKVTMAMKIHRLIQVEAIDYPTGELRDATRGDRDLIIDWSKDFHAESLPDKFTDQVIRSIERQIAAGLLQLWEDKQSRTMLGYGQLISGNGRIGPVYTPPEQRCQGYGTASVARLSKRLLENGAEACFLFTDVSNPTSNRIYRKIGYQPVGDYRMMTFSELQS